MKIFKFGGASIKDAESVKNVAHVLQHEGVENTFVVVSAMGKMTNAFEHVVEAYLNDKKHLHKSIDFIQDFHAFILGELFDKNDLIIEKVASIFEELQLFLNENKNQNYNFVYDQIVPFGELISTNIISAYLNKCAIDNNWLDARTLIKTDNYYRDAKVDWSTSIENIQKKIKRNQLNITQGFIGCDGNFTTTLGREGSDFTAAIFGYCLDAKSVTIWKDVDGVFNADPRTFENTVLLEQISYREAIEMAFYGASVIHPKTLKPLENKLIPLFVKSFKNLDAKGTLVTKGEQIIPKTPCFVVKKNQRLVSISAQDFSFILEHHISEIFQCLHKYKLKVNLIQNSALSFSMCVEDKYQNFDSFFNEMHAKYRIVYNENLTLFTIRHFNREVLDEVEKNNAVLLKQTSRETVQIVIE